MPISKMISLAVVEFIMLVFELSIIFAAIIALVSLVTFDLMTYVISSLYCVAALALARYRNAK